MLRSGWYKGNPWAWCFLANKATLVLLELLSYVATSDPCLAHQCDWQVSQSLSRNGWKQLGAHCLVPWLCASYVCVLGHKISGYALHIRWMWLHCMTPLQTLNSLTMQHQEVVHQMFHQELSLSWGMGSQCLERTAFLCHKFLSEKKAHLMQVLLVAGPPTSMLNTR